MFIRDHLPYFPYEVMKASRQTNTAETVGGQQLNYSIMHQCYERNDSIAI